ncbi:MAG TPA: heavy metal translocating P-type ATPase [Pelomicrobium sp.]|nr:heavy metal translocating P-type ATPase [Pelomicrobium sp.]
MTVSKSASVATGAAESCFHCGLPVPAGTAYAAVIDGARRPMCCPGCEAVAESIVCAGLGDYYRHRSALPVSPQDTVPEFLKQLAVYDAPQVQASFVRVEGADVREASLILEGIRCAACVWLNEQHLARLPGVLSVNVNYTTHRARVRWDASRIRLSEILRAIAAIGYTAHPFDPARQEEVHRKERRRALWELFVAGFGAMQVMMYAVPVYLAGDGDMPRDIEALMHWAGLVLTLPVVLFSAARFFRGAWSDLRAGRVGMDVPVALGVALAFAASVWATVTGEGQVYFDSVAMFVFFLLGGRYLEMTARQRAGDATERLARVLPALARRLPGFPATLDDETVAVGELAVGDHLLVKPGETIPADGRIVDGATSVDESLLTGESRPIARRAGERLTGGAVNVESPVVLRVEAIGQDTVLAGIVRLLDRALAHKPPIATLADRVAGWFVAVLLVVAAGVYLGWHAVDPARALWITVAVLVVTCPCALSLATPTALAAATSRLTRRGLLVTRGHVLETLARATHIVFDKTGTLTLGQPAVRRVSCVGGRSPQEALTLAVALEAGSEHPLAGAITAAAREQGAASARAQQVTNCPGRGVEGLVAGKRLRIGRPDFVAELAGVMPSSLAADAGDADTLVALGDESGWIAAFALGDTLRPDAADGVARLRRQGVRVALLSGDRPEAVAAVARELGIDEAIGAATPADKLAYVERLQGRGAVVAMVGDGINDAPVLAQAQVSVAVGDATQVAQASADAVLVSSRLTELADAHVTARRTLRVVRQNLGWAVAYNVVALPLAIAGYVTPWLAGIGMAASSLLVVLNALRLLRDGGTSMPARQRAGRRLWGRPALSADE